MGPTRRAALAATASLVAFGGCGRRSAPRLGAGAQRPPGVAAAARVGFGGDIMLGRSVDERHRDDPPEAVWGSAHDYLGSLDGLVANLECCVSDRGEKWPNKVYYFRADPDWALPALETAGTACVSLANNHTLDFGEVALRDTLTGLSDAGIATTGAGADFGRATAPATVDIGGLTVGVLGLTDRMPAYAAGDDTPGTAMTPLTPRNPRTRRVVSGALDALSDADLVVVSLHWGPNWETVKNPGYRTFARWLVDRGVDAVHGHSAHVVQGVEVYRGRPILYDCGDLVDDYVVKPDLRNDRTFLFELVVDDGIEAVRLVPLEIEDSTAHLAGEEATAWLHDRMRARCEPFGTTLREEGGSGVLRVPVADE